MEASDESSLSEDQKSSESPEGNKIERPDVVYKTILRCFKKHYVLDFNKLTEYKKMKRRVIMKNSNI